jgi:hypothetical protein
VVNQRGALVHTSPAAHSLSTVHRVGRGVRALRLSRVRPVADFVQFAQASPDYHLRIPHHLQEASPERGPVAPRHFAQDARERLPGKMFDWVAQGGH